MEVEKTPCVERGSEGCKRKGGRAIAKAGSSINEDWVNQRGDRVSGKMRETKACGNIRGEMKKKNVVDKIADESTKEVKAVSDWQKHQGAVGHWLKKVVQNSAGLRGGAKMDRCVATGEKGDRGHKKGALGDGNAADVRKSPICTA